MSYTSKRENLHFHTQADFTTNSIEFHAFLRDGDVVQFVTNADVGAAQSIYERTPAEPLFRLTQGQAVELYEQLGRVLGRLDSATLESVVKAQEKHLADLREIAFRVVK